MESFRPAGQPSGIIGTPLASLSAGEHNEGTHGSMTLVTARTENVVTEFIKALFRAPLSRPLPDADSSRQHWITNTWHAVSVVAPSNACATARKLNRVRFLSKEAPPLPLADCDARTCACHYRHHQDRRSEPRRESDVGASGRHWAGAERRYSPGRRVND